MQEARELVPKWKDRVITYERDLLYTMAFDLNVTHPFKALQDLMKAVRGACLCVCVYDLTI